MSQTIQQLTGVDFPLFAFSHCRDVVVAVSRAGGFGVLGAASFYPEELERELRWIDEHIGGRPYGVDILFPENDGIGSTPIDALTLAAKIPDKHRQFTIDLLRQHGIEMAMEDTVDARLPTTSPEVGEQLLSVALRHPIRLIANALGVAPPRMIEAGHSAGIPVAALVGTGEHARRQIAAGVDILVAQGGEAGGHCGEVSTMVLLPEVLEVARATRPVPVLAAGGIVRGSQMAGCVAMGAAGAWTGTIWLATAEAETSQAVKGRLVAATSRDTVRSKSRTGKPSRQLHSAWHDAWDGPHSPGALPMPLMHMLSGPAFAHIEKASEQSGEPNALTSYFMGQGIGLIDDIRLARRVVDDFRKDFANAVESLMHFASMELESGEKQG